MTGTDILRQAYMLLNYTDANGDINAANNANISKRALPIINQIYADLWHMNTHKTAFKILTTMNETLDLDAYTAINIMPYGVAMLLAQSEGDSDNQSIYAALYNQRRAGAATHSERVADRLPRTYL